jgi:hypothetical protein
MSIGKQSNPVTNFFDGLLDRVNSKSKGEDTEEIPTPGSEENPWIGVEQFVSGQKQFIAFSGKQRRRLRRHAERYAVKESKTGERAYNRQQRQREFDAGTVRQQARILQGDIPVSPDMMANLHGHILRQTRLNERALVEQERKEAADERRHERLFGRVEARFRAGQPRGKDLRSERWELFYHLLPVGYAGKGGTV